MFDIKPPPTQRNLYIRPARLPLWDRAEKVASDQRKSLCEVVAVALEHYLPTVEQLAGQDREACCVHHPPPLNITVTPC